MKILGFTGPEKTRPGITKLTQILVHDFGFVRIDNQDLAKRFVRDLLNYPNLNLWPDIYENESNRGELKQARETLQRLWVVPADHRTWLLSTLKEAQVFDPKHPEYGSWDYTPAEGYFRSPSSYQGVVLSDLARDDVTTFVQHGGIPLYTGPRQQRADMIQLNPNWDIGDILITLRTIVK